VSQSTLLLARAIRKKWGEADFRVVAAARVNSLRISEEDKLILSEVGLPQGPKRQMILHLRWESVRIRHQAKIARVLSDELLFVRDKFYPATEEDRNLDLTAFVVLGEGPNDFERDSFIFLNRFICLDGKGSGVYWVYPAKKDRGVSVSRINSSLLAYLSSLLAYRRFRSDWKELRRSKPDPKEFRKRILLLWNRFLRELRKADPIQFEEGFWYCHAQNERILMGV
jgi:hypothetical protein